VFRAAGSAREMKNAVYRLNPSCRLTKAEAMPEWITSKRALALFDGRLLVRLMKRVQFCVSSFQSRTALSIVWAARREAPPSPRLAAI